MMSRSRPWLGPLATPLRHCMAAVAMFAQCLVVIAPLADAREAAPLPPTIASAMEAGRTNLAVDSDHGHQNKHNAATCPACIAQAFIAHVSPSTSILLVESDERALRNPTSERALQPQLLSLQRSRAPPLHAADPM